MKFKIDEILEIKKYLIIYFLVLLIGAFSLTTLNNLHAPLKEILMFIFLLVIGAVFLINTIEKNIELYKSVFFILLIIGIIFSVMTPIYDIHDEQEHFTRAEILSRGILVPEVSNA